MKAQNQDTKFVNIDNIYVNQNDEHKDEDSVDSDYSAKNYPMVEHLSNARLMPQTGPMGGLDFLDTYEYAAVPVDPATPMDSYEVIMDKNKKK